MLTAIEEKRKKGSKRKGRRIIYLIKKDCLCKYVADKKAKESNQLLSMLIRKYKNIDDTKHTFLYCGGICSNLVDGKRTSFEAALLEKIFNALLLLTTTTENDNLIDNYTNSEETKNDD